MSNRPYFETIVLSDIHIGSEYSKFKEAIAFLRAVDCKKLILNGDIIDGWKLKKNSVKWKKSYTAFLKVLMKKMSKNGTGIIYVRGNHDDFLDQVAPFRFAQISIVKDYVHESHGKRYFVLHGDVFDSITTHVRWLAKMGDVGYSILLWINKHYNRYRLKKERPYYSLSQTIKQKVKTAVSYISDFEKELVALARNLHFDGIICGHIHHPANVFYDGIHYLNSGDWVESLSALVEKTDGTWEILYYEDFCKEFEPDMAEEMLLTETDESTFCSPR
ncbi:UDP-2,3-diacylglucosamine hydrolase [Bacteroidia bacterium]|nr:UDP-2,3-diacylglucosamine hydrolase [Bacteroidia bacterium]GHT27182.1 UDP-2,3-diacylglucosamine hydrolase [Bacteroidia bacterium]GHV71179.1 UDP-2,3-diacylglucosamine hydrolase [Bacteroidia bacterium]